MKRRQVSVALQADANPYGHCLIHFLTILCETLFMSTFLVLQNGNGRSVYLSVESVESFYEYVQGKNTFVICNSGRDHTIEMKIEDFAQLLKSAGALEIFSPLDHPEK
jgi:hypothetical protein